jgi:methylenetetrahydrofolate dehydrogenase (NADP+)/methenyltetrahydrofolate cyclohydrolase
MNFWESRFFKNFNYMKLIDGRKIRDEILAGIKKEISGLSFQPVFCDILVGNDPASVQYVNMKAKIAESVGIKFLDAKFPESTTTEDLISEIKKLNEQENICGIIVQLPLPEHINKQEVLNAVDPMLDVDCLGEINSQKFYKSEYALGFPTALACIYILDSLNLDLKNKNIVVLGQGELVGRPVSAILKLRKLDIEVLTSESEYKEEKIKDADVIISGIGEGKHLTGDMLKKDVVLLDAGTSESNNSIIGDVDLDSVKDIASFVSPVPGGIGPVTIAMLFKNVLIVAKNKNDNK